MDKLTFDLFNIIKIYKETELKRQPQNLSNENYLDFDDPKNFGIFVGRKSRSAHLRCF